MAPSEDQPDRTPPGVPAGEILTTGGSGFDGYRIARYRGMVWGVSVQTRRLMELVSKGLARGEGVELDAQTALADESRRRAMGRMLAMASDMGANAIVEVDFEHRRHLGWVEEVVRGTAVTIEPLPEEDEEAPANPFEGVLEELQEIRKILFRRS